MFSCFRRIDRSAGPAAAAVLALVGGLSLAAPARALDDDGRKSVFSSVLGLLELTPSDPQPDIDYRERPPLALPPKTELPPPVAEQPESPAWPNDPDVQRRKAEASKLRLPSLLTRDGASTRLTKEQLISGRRTSGTDVTGAPDSNPYPDMKRCSQGRCTWVSPAELAREGAAGKKADQDSSGATVAGVEPDRRFLTDPPRGYRKASRTVKATSEIPTPQDTSPFKFWQSLNPLKKDDDE
jgi:hypothetical protein